MTASTGPVDVGRHEALRTVGQFMQFIGLCHCGAPEGFLGEVMRGLDCHPGPGEPRPARRLKTDDRADMLILYLLDCWDLTDHGTTILGGWLTPDGVRLRDALHTIELTDGNGRSDLDKLLPGASWWKNEHVLNPRRREGVPYAELGEWKPEDL